MCACGTKGRFGEGGGGRAQLEGGRTCTVLLNPFIFVISLTINSNFLSFALFGFDSETGFIIFLRLALHSLCSQGWPWAGRDPPTLAPEHEDYR